MGESAQVAVELCQGLWAAALAEFEANSEALEGDENGRPEKPEKPEKPGRPGKPGKGDDEEENQEDGDQEAPSVGECLEKVANKDDSGAMANVFESCAEFMDRNKNFLNCLKE